jgi:hypothetical protein
MTSMKGKERIKTQKTTGLVMPRKFLLARKSHYTRPSRLVVVLTRMKVDRFLKMQQ